MRDEEIEMKVRLKACRSPLRGKDGRENENRIFV